MIALKYGLLLAAAFAQAPWDAVFPSPALQTQAFASVQQAPIMYAAPAVYTAPAIPTPPAAYSAPATVFSPATVATVAPLVPRAVAPPTADAAKKAAADAKAKQAAHDAVVDARIVNRARWYDVYGSHLPPAALVPSPIAFGGPIGAAIKTESLGSIVRSREKVARSFQRQINRYIPAHPNATRDDLNTVNQWRGKRDENLFWGDANRVEAVRTFVPGSSPISAPLSFLSTSTFLDSYNGAEDAQYHATQLARDKYLKNISNAENRRAYNQARATLHAKREQQVGTSAELANKFLPLTGSPANTAIGAFGSRKMVDAADTESHIAHRNRLIAEQKYAETPTTDNLLALKLARATEQWKDNAYDYAKSRSLPFAFPKWSLIFGARKYQDYWEVQDSQRRVSRISLEIKRRAYDKLFTGADTTQQRLLALDSYGRPAARAPPASPYPAPFTPPLGRVY